MTGIQSADRIGVSSKLGEPDRRAVRRDCGVEMPWRWGRDCLAHLLRLTTAASSEGRFHLRPLATGPAREDHRESERK